MKDVYEEAYKRRNDNCNIPLEQICKELHFSVKDIENILEMVESEEEI